MVQPSNIQVHVIMFLMRQSTHITRQVGKGRPNHGSIIYAIAIGL